MRSVALTLPLAAAAALAFGCDAEHDGGFAPQVPDHRAVFMQTCTGCHTPQVAMQKVLSHGSYESMDELSQALKQVMVAGNCNCVVSGDEMGSVIKYLYGLSEGEEVH